jgi:hypothetical protein
VEVFSVYHPGMSWWGSRDSEPVAVAEPPVDREAQAREHVVALKAQLDELNLEMRAFKNKNSILSDRFGRLLGIHCDSVNGREKLEREWRALLRKRDGLVDAWHKALFAWAAAKEAAQ